jgi:hypothetical protein
VYVQVENRLSGARTYVQHRAVALFDAAFARNVRGHKMALADRLGIAGPGLLQAPDVFLGNYQYVGWALRVDVLKGVNALIFVDFLAGYFAPDDAAEQTVIHDTSRCLAVQQQHQILAAWGREAHA